MSTIRMWGLIGGLAVVWVASAGCVSRDEFLREKFAKNKALENAETLARDLADERNRTLAMESERASLRRELDSKSALAETLKAENDRLTAFSEELKSKLDELARKGVGDIQVVEVKLPPELDRALKEFAAQYPDEVTYDEHRGAVRWKSDLTFGKGSDAVRPGALQSLRAFAEIVKSAAASQFEVIVVGHTDNLRIGPATARKHPTNWHLSVHRAIAVMNALAKDGVPQERLGVMGYGEFRPVVPNPPRGGAEANRRVEIFLVAGRDDAPREATALSPTSEQ
ncbi:MAG: OmpA family protein [Phycisphaerae bacterium]